MFGQIQSSLTGDERYSNPSPYRECSLEGGRERERESGRHYNKKNRKEYDKLVYKETFNKGERFIRGELIYRAVVVAQLVERLLSTPEIRSLNPIIGNCIYYQLYQCIEKTTR